MGCLSSLYLPCEKHSPKAAQSFSGGFSLPSQCGQLGRPTREPIPNSWSLLRPQTSKSFHTPRRGRPFTGACSHPVAPLLPGHPPSPKRCLPGPDWPTSASVRPPALSHLLPLALWLTEDLSPASPEIDRLLPPPQLPGLSNREAAGIFAEFPGYTSVKAEVFPPDNITLENWI